MVHWGAVRLEEVLDVAKHLEGVQSQPVRLCDQGRHLDGPLLALRCRRTGRHVQGYAAHGQGPGSAHATRSEGEHDLRLETGHPLHWQQRLLHGHLLLSRTGEDRRLARAQYAEDLSLPQGQCAPPHAEHSARTQSPLPHQPHGSAAHLLQYPALRVSMSDGQGQGPAGLSGGHHEALDSQGL